MNAKLIKKLIPETRTLGRDRHWLMCGDRGQYCSARLLNGEYVDIEIAAISDDGITLQITSVEAFSELLDGLEGTARYHVRIDDDFNWWLTLAESSGDFVVNSKEFNTATEQDWLWGMAVVPKSKN